MRSVKNIPASEIVEIIRDISGKAEFIHIMLHDGDIKLNDPGDIAIPSRTERSKALDLGKSDLALLSEINNFIVENETRSA
jgi:hypothetical protein